MARLPWGKQRLSLELTKTKLGMHIAHGAAFSENIIIIHRMSQGEEQRPKGAMKHLPHRNAGISCRGRGVQERIEEMT